MITAMPRIAIATATEDFGRALELFGDVLAMPVADFSDSTVPSLGTHVGMCQPDRGSNIELMAPATPGLPLSDAIQKTIDRRGEGFYALMLEAPDPDAEAEELIEREVNVLPLMAGAGGRDIHPRSTHGVLIRIYPDGSVAQPTEPRTGLVGLSGITRAVVATSDAAKAARAYGEGLGLAVVDPVDDDERGVRSVIVTPPAGGRIELVSATEPTRPFGAAIRRAVEKRGEGLYAIVLEADDRAAALEAMADRGLTFSGPDHNETTVFGARILIEEHSL
mgnify:CR=1 FL=1